MNAVSPPLNNPRRGRPSTAGIALVELLVGVALALFLILGVVTVFTSTVRGSADNLRSARLNQELSAVMEMMVNDIRRTGYTNNQLLYSQDISIPSASCILYRYNENQDNIEDGIERHGFKRVVSAAGIGRIEFGTDVANCNGDWPDLTDPGVVNVTSLDLSTTGSKCLNRGTANASDHPGPIAFWVTTSETELGFPCSEPNGSADVSYYIYDVANQVYASTPSTHVAPQVTNGSDPGDRTVETRHVNITLTGEALGDPATSKTLRAAVKVRNDFVRTH